MRKLVVLPLYPQQSTTTTASIFDAVTAELRAWDELPEIRWVSNYYAHPAYTEALCRHINAQWDQIGKPDRLLFSFHGIPKSLVDRGDPYLRQCRRSADLLAKALKLDHEKWSLAFQSRFGPQEWLKPYTVDLLKLSGQDGSRRLDVVCPGFAVDCLETLVEIEIEGKQIYEAAGGENLHYIPALNDLPEHIEMLSRIVLDDLA